LDYLRWYRRVAGLDVRSGVRVAAIAPEGEGLFRLGLADGAAAWARYVVLATGRDGLGGPRILPGFDPAWRGALWAHSSDAIGFAALRGRRVAVVGAGASAFDNAAEALEAGCAALTLLVRRPALLVRRPALPAVNASKALDSRGHAHGWASLPDAWRWRLMREVERRQTPPPREAVLRVARHPNAGLRLGCPVLGVARRGDALRLETPAGAAAADFVVLGTGFAQDLGLRPELAAVAPEIRLWRDAHAPPPGEEDPALGASPYLDEAFAFTPRRPGRAPHLARLHAFNHAATLSLGKLSGDVPAISAGAGRLARGICARLLAADVEAHWRRLRDFGTPELLGDEWGDAGG
jgi:FAD-dependent urate hydroxylase